MNPDGEKRLFSLLSAMFDGEMTDAERTRLADLLRDNPQSQQFYLDFCWTHALLRRELGVYGEVPFTVAGVPPLLEWKGDRRQGASLNSPSSASQSFVPTVPPFIVVQPSPHSQPSPLSLDSLLGGMLFSYGVAVVILGMMLLGAWAYKITHYHQIADYSQGQTAPGGSARERPELVFVGRISGMKDCKWSDPKTEAYAGSSVPLGRKYALASGLMQITYDSGAKVILQGPCTYEVESRSGGYLSLGKLTARIEERREKREERVKPQAANLQISKSPNPKSPVPRPPFPAPLFSVRTPTAIVTDLGTEFGVEVEKDGNTISHVFRGSVKVQVVGDGPRKDVVLRADESARVEAGAARRVTVMRRSAAKGAFAREMPRRERIKVFNTGIGAKEGEPDPHWELAAFFQSAINNDPKSRPAVVTSVTQQFRPNDAERSQWISSVGDLSSVRGGRYTFRTAFELPADAASESAALLVRFIADNYVEAVRLNGRIVPLSETGYDPPHDQFDRFHSFSIRKGFVAGNNVLEFDVFNYHASSGTPMALLVELEGYVVCGWRGEKKGTGPISPDGPEGAAHKLAPSPSSHPDAGKEGNP